MRYKCTEKRRFTQQQQQNCTIFNAVCSAASQQECLQLYKNYFVVIL